MTDTATEIPPLNDKQIRALLDHSLNLLNKNELLAAEAALQRVLAERATEADACNLMGVLRRMQGRYGEAEEFYRRAIDSNPNLAQAHHNLGNLLRSIGRNAEAADCQREAIRIKPNYVDAHLNLGRVLQFLGDYRMAEKCFREALRLQPNYLMAKQCLGAALNEMNRGKEAETVLRQAVSSSVRDKRQTAALLHNLGVSVKQQPRHAEVPELLYQAQALVPEMPHADYNRGNVLQHLGRAEDAIDAYRSAIAHNPLDLNAHRDLNHLLYRLGRDDEFLRSYDDAARVYPEVGQLYLNKANFQFQIGDFGNARENFERAVPLLPSNVTPHDG